MSASTEESGTKHTKQAWHDLPPVKKAILLFTLLALGVEIALLSYQIAQRRGRTELDKLLELERAEAEAPPTRNETLQKKVQSLRTLFVKFPEEGKNAIFADSLASLYKAVGMVDSAAWFAEKAAVFFESRESFEKAGSYFYSAYEAASEPNEQDRLGERARFFLEKLLSEPGGRTTGIEVKIAKTYLESSAPAEGISRLEKILKRDPDNEEALLGLGAASIRLKKYKNAIEWMERAVALYPENPEASLLLGIALLHSGANDEAGAQFRKVIEGDTSDAVRTLVKAYLEDLK